MVQKTGPYLLVAFIAAYYLLGFFYTDPIIERQIADEVLFHLPVIEHFSSLPFQEAVKDYKSATFPLFHVIYGVFHKYLTADPAGLRMINLSVILLTSFLFFFYFVRFLNLGKKTSLVIVAAFLSSPFLRATGFALTTDHMPFLFLALSLISFQFGIERKNAGFFILSSFFAFCMFYTRQFYFWAPFYIFFSGFFKTGSRQGKLLLFLANTAFVLPALYLASVWKGFVPPMWQDDFHSPNLLMTLPFALAMFPIYFFPVFLFLGIENRTNLAPRKIALLVGAGIVFVLLYSLSGFDLGSVQGGLISKIFMALPQAVSAPAFLLFSFAGGLIIFYYLWKNFAKNYYLLLIAIGLSISSIIFQRYADPLLFFSALLFYDYKAGGRFIHSKFLYLFIATEILLFVSALVYYQNSPL